MQLSAKHLARCLILALCLALPSATLANEDDSAGSYYVVKVWGPEDGLTEDSVSDVAQTPEGYLWIGTMFGDVLRFDGVRFVKYNSANTPELSQRGGVSQMMVDHDGTLWISMSDGGMNRWDQQGFHSVFTTNQVTPHAVVSAWGWSFLSVATENCFPVKKQPGNGTGRP